MSRHPFILALLLLLPAWAAAQPAPSAAPLAGESSPNKDGAVERADRHCLRSTGSRIRRGDDGCLPVSGVALTREEIDSTGAVTVSDAIRRLVPAATVGGR